MKHRQLMGDVGLGDVFGCHPLPVWIVPQASANWMSSAASQFVVKFIQALHITVCLESGLNFVGVMAVLLLSCTYLKEKGLLTGCTNLKPMLRKFGLPRWNAIKK